MIVRMTIYAVEAARGVLLATWDTGVGSIASMVAGLPKGYADDSAVRLASYLTELSRLAWHTYTHPPSAAQSLEANGEG